MRKIAVACVNVLVLITMFGCLGPKSANTLIEQTLPPPTQTPVIVIQVLEVTVTRVIEVTRQVEVTRVVTLVITATPEPTATPTNTPTPEPSSALPSAPAVSSMKTQLLNSLIALRYEIEVMNFDELIVKCSRGYEDSLTDHYESIIAYPSYDVTGSSAIIQKAHNDYRQAIAIINSTNRDLYTFCLDWIAKGKPQEYISQLTASVARQGINDALGLILPAIELLQ